MRTQVVSLIQDHERLKTTTFPCLLHLNILRPYGTFWLEATIKIL